MKQEKISRKQLREFGFITGFSFPIIIGFLLPLISGHVFKTWTLLIGLLLLLLAIINPKLLLYPYKKWIIFGNFLGFINSHIILGLIFFVVLFPISIFMKFFGYDPLRLKNKNLNSFREDKKNHKFILDRIF